MQVLETMRASMPFQDRRAGFMDAQRGIAPDTCGQYKMETLLPILKLLRRQDFPSIARRPPVRPVVPHPHPPEAACPSLSEALQLLLAQQQQSPRISCEHRRMGQPMGEDPNLERISVCAQSMLLWSQVRKRTRAGTRAAHVWKGGGICFLCVLQCP